MKKQLVALLIASVLLSACNFLRPEPKPQTAPRVAAGVSVEGLYAGGMLPDELEAVVGKLAVRHYIVPGNARFDEATGEVLPDTPGWAVDVPATVREVIAAAPGSGLRVICRELQPEITAARLKQAIRLGGFISPILDTSPGRLENIRLTARLINNSVLNPGEEFSFNRQTGEPTLERGFQQAAVIVGGRKEQGVGGGMCQVSSTLYNAVLEAGLPVVERHAHSLPVSYVPPERDAATYSDKDFRFINNTRHVLVLRAFSTGAKLTVDLWRLPR